MINSFLESALGFMSQNWQSIPLNERFIYTPWVVVAVLYLILGYYDRLHNRVPKRKVFETNFRFYIYLSCIIPYFIFLLLRTRGTAIPLDFDSDIAKIISFVIAWSGAAFIGVGRIQLDGYWGPDIYEYENPSDRKIVDIGLYRKTRHPIYFGQWLLILGTGISTQNVLFAFFSPAFALILIVIRATKEEQYMKASFGPSWTEYLRKTAFFPWNGIELSGRFLGTIRILILVAAIDSWHNERRIIRSG